MKKTFILTILVCCSALALTAQEFNKHLADAKTAYASGKLDDSRFAMQQALQELDIITGKEVLKLLPATMINQNMVTTLDNVSGASGYLGVIIHREYGIEHKHYDSLAKPNINLEIISHSPLIGSINAILALPFIGNNPDQKIIKVAGYKGLVQKISGNSEKPEYEFRLPLNSALVTLKAPGYSQDDLIRMANSLPIAEIAKMIQ